jgi:hypothetical protein
LRPNRHVVVLAALATAIMGGCGSDDGQRPPMLELGPLPTTDAGHFEASSPDACATPGVQGCRCDQAGAVAECGKILQRYGDYVTCSKGHSWCDGETWGECVGDRVVTEPASAAGALAGDGS